MKAAFLFPGQGAQMVGMGKDLCQAYPASSDIFDRAEAASGLKLRELCFDGPDDMLARTDISQPAIFTVSAALLEAMKTVLGDGPFAALGPAVMAGLSLGEYTALYAAGAMDFETALKLVARRGELMQAAAEEVPSGMVSVIGLDEAHAEELCLAAAQGQVLTCANFNCPGQIVVSGHAEACERAADMAADFGASAAVPLKVAGAFHSDLMKSAADRLGAAIDEISFGSLGVTVISNTDADEYVGTGQIKPRLLAQLVSPVRWQESMGRLLADGVDTFYEIGPGRVLAGLMRRIHRRADFTNVNNRETVEKLAADGNAD